MEIMTHTKPAGVLHFVGTHDPSWTKQDRGNKFHDFLKAIWERDALVSWPGDRDDEDRTNLEEVEWKGGIVIWAPRQVTPEACSENYESIQLLKPD